MQMASLTGLLRTALWVLIGWFILRTVSRMFRTQRRGFQEEQAKAPGSVSIDKNTPPSAGTTDVDAEFVEFEEIDDSTT